VYALTPEEFAKGLLDKDATKIIETGLADTSDWKLQGLGGPEGDQAFNLGDIWNNLKNKAEENERLRREYREKNPGGYPGQPENLKQRDLEKEYPDLRKEPQEFSQQKLNEEVATLVGKAAMGVAEKHPEWVGLENDYFDGTDGRMAQDIFNRPDRSKIMSNQDMIDLLKRVGVKDVSAWKNPPGPSESTWKDKGYPYPGFEENTYENIRRRQGYTDDNNDGSTEDEYLDYMRLIKEVKEKGDRLDWEK
jgi:hypothetical protein